MTDLGPAVIAIYLGLRAIAGAIAKRKIDLVFDTRNLTVNVVHHAAPEIETQ